jgi:clathrin heavy chain
MCRSKLRETRIETALLYSYAKTNMLPEMEEYLSAPNSAQVQDVGERSFQQGLYEAAKLCFSALSNFGDLATTLVKLGQYSAAVDAARKANSPKVWKQVCFACVDAGEFKLAAMCGQQIVVVADELESLVGYYEQRGHFDDIITLIEQSLGLERAHVGLFTELASLLSNYRPEKLMEHLNLFYSRMNIPKVIRVCQMNQQWAEVVFLQCHYDEFDNATNTMMDHSADCFNHVTFKQTVVKVSNSELCYRAIKFYLTEQPLLVNDVLSVLIPRLEHARVCMMVDKEGKLPFIKQYLQSVQDTNISPVNEALNRLYIEEEDFEALRSSITQFDNFDQIGLAMQLEKHDLVEFRRIAAELYRRNKRFDQAVRISKDDKLYKDAIDTAAYSQNTDLAEGLLKYFIEELKSKECFAACLFTCYDLIRPDVALELAWKNQVIDFVMPFMIQVMREYITKVDSLEEKLKPKPEEQTQPTFQQPMGLNPGMLALPGPMYGGMPY